MSLPNSTQLRIKAKVLNALLIVSSLFGFLEWGPDHKMFLFQMEAEVFTILMKDPFSMIHPLVILPLLGQVLLAISLFQKTPGKLLTYFGTGGIGMLLFMMFLAGIFSLNPKILLSTIPFFIIAFLAIRHSLKTKMDSFIK